MRKTSFYVSHYVLGLFVIAAWHSLIHVLYKSFYTNWYAIIHQGIQGGAPPL